jgi:ABC-type arginine/histidine transport system permease subunit
MDINNSGLEGVHVSLMVALVSAGLGLLIALIMASS